MQRVERHIIIKDSNIDIICYLSKNLYNLANYYIRQEFINNKRWIRYNELDKLLQKTEAYKSLPAATSQQILRLIDKNWLSFFRNIKLYKKNGSLGKPKLPKYKDKEKGRNIVIFTGKQVKLVENFIYFPKKANLQPVKTKVNNICQVRVVPQATCYIIEVVYNKGVLLNELNNGTYLSIDLGINNLATCTNNIGIKPFIVNGKIIKSINQYFNKTKAVLQSYVGDKGISNRILKLTHKRNMKINDYLHKTSRFIINYCLKHKIKTTIIGYNENWKQGINIGKVNNQKFTQIPFSKLVNQIQYKAEEVGIGIILNEESYTSKCSFIDKEEICKHDSYIGKRIKRGLFKTSNGTLINADINGSLNILRKVIGDTLYPIEGLALNPVIINVI
jgi:putative transposase